MPQSDSVERSRRRRRRASSSPSRDRSRRRRRDDSHDSRERRRRRDDASSRDRRSDRRARDDARPSSSSRPTTASTPPKTKHKAEVLDWRAEMAASSDEESDDGAALRRAAAEREARLQALEEKATEKAPTVASVTTQEVQKTPTKAAQNAEPAEASEEVKEESGTVTPDMFAMSKGQSILKQVNAAGITQSNTGAVADADGYYDFRTGETLANRYAIDSKLGSGVFSVVLKAHDTSVPPGAAHHEVAVKIVRANSVMTKSGRLELGFLKRLAVEAQQESHCLRLLDDFVHKGHLCIVLESMGLNLREVLEKYGKAAGALVGLGVDTVRLYTQQLCVALRHLEQRGVIHGDFKPDNVLVDASTRVLKLADFGSGMNVADDSEPTQYLASRFYRAPEVILGAPFDCGIDMWALGATVYELLTGQIMFRGADNSDMLLLQQEVRGGIPKRMKAGKFEEHFFDQNKRFIHFETDPVTKRRKEKLMTFTNPVRPVKELLKHMVPQDALARSHFMNVCDFIVKATVIDTAHRMTPSDAFHHPLVVSS